MVRGGFVARAVTYGMIGGISLALALGAGGAGEAPNQQGALALIAKAPLGRVVLIVIAVGLLAYAAWKIRQALEGRGPEGGGGPKPFDRAANAAGGLVYLAFFAVALRVVLGTSNSGSSEARHTAAGVLGWPGGPAIVAIAGIAMVAISIYQIVDAVRGSFADEVKVEEMSSSQLHGFLALGVVGLIARALVFALVGYFLIRTAINYDPGSAVGVDGALAAVRHQAYGPWLLGAVAAGLLVFAVYSLLEGRYRQL